MPKAEQETVDLLTEYFAAMEAKDLGRLSSFYADDIALTFANAPTVHGRDAVLQQMADLLERVDSVAHPLTNVWQEDGGVVLFEVTTDWRLRNGAQVSINACSIFTVHDGRFVDQRIYVDNAPVQPFLG